MNTSDFCVYSFYFMLNFFTLCSLIMIRENYFQIYSIVFHIILIATMIISYYLIITLRLNPGVIKNESSETIVYQNVVNQVEISMMSDNNDEKNITEGFCEKCEVIIVFSILIY